MPLRRKEVPDLIELATQEGLLNPGSPVRLIIGTQGNKAAGYISLDDLDTPASSADVIAPYDQVSCVPGSVGQLLVAMALDTVDHAHAIALLLRWCSWIADNGRITLQLIEGDWNAAHPAAPGARFSWTKESMLAVLDHFHIAVTQPGDRSAQGRLIMSGVHLPQTRLEVPKAETIWRLVAGPLCSLGHVPPEQVESFANRCLSFLGAAALPVPVLKTRPRRAPSDKLRILHTVEFYAPRIGGAELVVQKLSERLTQRGHHVTVATRALPERSFDELRGVDIEQFDIDGSAARGISGPDVRRYMQFLQEFDCDLMMNYAAQQWATDLAIPLLPRIARRANVLAPCGYSALKGDAASDNSVYNYFSHMLPAMLPKYDAVVCHSAQYQDFAFGERNGIRNQLVIPNAVDEAEFDRPVSVDFRSKYGITERYMLLCVANFLDGKGQERLITALRAMQRPDVTLVLVGKEGPMLPGLRRWAQDANVRFLVGIPREDTLAAFQAADLFVFSSLVEASPLVILEAKASRLAFVSTDAGNVKEFKGGIVCAPEELADQIRRLLDNESERKLLAESGYREYREKFTWAAVTDQYEALYQRLVAAKRERVASAAHF